MKNSSASPPPAVARILVISDNPHGLVARRGLLEQAGYDAHGATSAEAAIAEFERFPFDVVVTNYRLPSMMAGELIARFRAIRPDTLVVLVSGLTELLGLTEESTGADAVIAKSPHDGTHLVRTVNRLLRTRPPKKPMATFKTVTTRTRAVELG